MNRNIAPLSEALSVQEDDGHVRGGLISVRPPPFLFVEPHGFTAVAPLHTLRRLVLRSEAPSQSSSGTLRSVPCFVPSFAKAMEGKKATSGTLIHPRLHRQGFLRSLALAEEGKNYTTILV